MEPLFSYMTQEIEPFCKYDTKLNFFSFWIWLKELNFFFLLNLTQFFLPFPWLKYLNLFWKFLIQRSGPSFQDSKFFSNKKSHRIELFWIRPTELNFFNTIHRTNSFFFQYDSQNWTFFFEYDSQNWTFFFFWIRLKEIDFSRIWCKELNRLVSWMWRRELNFCYDSKTWIFLIWLKELNFLIWIWLKELNFLKVWLKELNSLKIWLKELNSFWKYDSKNITLFADKKDSKNWTLFADKTRTIELFFEYDSKNWTLFWIRLKELNLFLNDSKNWSFFFDLQNWTLSFLNMTQRLELVFEYDSKNWTSFL